MFARDLPEKCTAIYSRQKVLLFVVWSPWWWQRRMMGVLVTPDGSCTYDQAQVCWCWRFRCLVRISRLLFFLARRAKKFFFPGSSVRLRWGRWGCASERQWVSNASCPAWTSIPSSVRASGSSGISGGRPPWPISGVDQTVCRSK